MPFSNKEYEKKFNLFLNDEMIRSSKEIFKIKLFLDKAENSLLISEHMKDLEPSQDQPKRLHWDYWAITVSYYSMLYAAKAAILSKGYEVSNHNAAQTALGHLLVPNELEKEDLELLNQSHKIFEDEYVHLFDDAKKESHIARYSAIKRYSQRRLEEIFKNAQEFVLKVKLILE